MPLSRGLDLEIESGVVGGLELHESGEETLARVELQEFRARASGASTQVLKVEVRAARDRVAAHLRHNKTCRTPRIFASVRGKLRAISINDAGLFPRPRSQRRSASTAASGPIW